jgi:hypothetical protein
MRQAEIALENPSQTWTLIGRLQIGFRNNTQLGGDCDNGWGMSEEVADIWGRSTGYGPSKTHGQTQNNATANLPAQLRIPYPAVPPTEKTISTD